MTIKQYLGNIKLNKKSLNLNLDFDLTYCAFKLAWNLAYYKSDKLVFPKHVICNYINPELISILSLVIEGDILIANTNDWDEWWITFCDIDGNDLDIIFYSPGA